ncbi:hypothetical protein QUB37_13665 [Microcoleus sp. AT3-A2]|uniref:hypothetical protein n=1 Tax=unclassified Microcoleus TaxID=2642155 RepID=UPI002FCF4F80
MITKNSVWFVVSCEVLSTNAPQAPQVLQTVKICSGISTAYRSNLRVAIPSACTALSKLIELNFSYLKRVEVYFLAFWAQRSGGSRLSPDRQRFYS